MKIICNQKLLAHKIGISQKAINGKTTLELLKGILISAKDNQLKLTGYDLEIGIETYAQAEIIEEGEIVVNARLFGDIIRKLPDSFVEIETDNDSYGTSKNDSPDGFAGSSDHLLHIGKREKGDWDGNLPSALPT